MKIQGLATTIISSMEQQNSRISKTANNSTQNSDTRSDKVTISEEGLSASRKRAKKSRNLSSDRADTVYNMGKKKASRFIIRAFNEDKKIDESISRREQKIANLWDDIKHGIGNAGEKMEEIKNENKAIKETMKWRAENPIIGDALALAEEAFAEASKEVIGVIYDECLKHLENEAEESAELIEILTEKAKEQEELLDNKKTDNNTLVEETKMILEKGVSSNAEKVKNILSKLELLEDL